MSRRSGNRFKRVIEWFQAAALDVVTKRRAYGRRLEISLVAPKASDAVATAALPAGQVRI